MKTYNSIVDVMDAAYDLMPYGKLSEQKKNAIIVAIRFTQASRAGVKSWKTTITYDKEGQELYNVQLSASSSSILEIITLLIDSGALFTLVRTERNFNGHETISTADFLFVTRKHHINNGVSIEADSQYDWENGTGDLRSSLKAAQHLANAADNADPAMVKWLAENIGTDEHQGPHLIFIQNMLHRIAQGDC